MTEEQFQQSLREYKYREPFHPFVIELQDGRVIEIDDPESVGFAGGAGGYLSPSDELLPFTCTQVRGIRELTPGRAP